MNAAETGDQVTSGNGGGYVVTPAKFTKAAVTVRVPTLRCVKANGAGSVRLGLFGADKSGSHL
jgi:hypothetical protein